jgi:hypothetical protein
VAIDIMDKFGPVETETLPSVSRRNPAPLSDLLGIPTLVESRGQTTVVRGSNQFVMDFVPLLTEHKSKTTSFGMPLLSKPTAKKDKSFGFPLLKEGLAKKDKSFGFPLLKEGLANKERSFGFPLLTRKKGRRP